MAKARRGGKRNRTGTPSSTPPVPGGTAREHWRRDGQPKSRFPSQDEANRASLQRRLEHGVDLDPYRCRFCDGWHLGNRRG